VDWLARARAVVSPRSQDSNRDEVSETKPAPFGAVFFMLLVHLLKGQLKATGWGKQ
jgi:hypothetical protein